MTTTKVQKQLTTLMKYDSCIIGPRHDKERHNIGIEYELLLEETLRSMGKKKRCIVNELHFSTHSLTEYMVQTMNNSDIPFETEAELRVRGTAKTPDILLSCPVGIRVRKRNEMTSPSPISLSPLAAKNEELIAATNMSSPNPKSKIMNAVDNHDDDTDDELYEWKIISWIDSKVRKTFGEYFFCCKAICGV